MARKMRMVIGMKFLWGRQTATSGSREILRHEFAIGPLHQSSIFKRKARLYFCIRCEWRFLVSGSKVAVLDDHDNPMTGAESLRRFNSFAAGPCPALNEETPRPSSDAGAPKLPVREKIVPIRSPAVLVPAARGVSAAQTRHP
jgi:hypothetical protein